MRTYYCIEEPVAAYPANEIRVQTRPFADPLTRAQSYRVRASSATEAETILRDRLNAERGAALEELARK